jgi:hypothetical protein
VAKPKVNKDDLAKEYGFTLAFLKAAGKEVNDLFMQAVNETWSPEKFEAKIRATKWFKTHGEQYRQQLALETTDPGTYQQNLNTQIAAIRDKAATMGTEFTDKQLRNLADHAVKFGWNDSQLNDVMSKYITYSSAKGQAGQNITSMQQTAWRNGIKLNGDTYRGWAQKIARGDTTVDDFNSYVRKQAASLAPSYADELKGGMDLYDIASPYMQSMASVLELNPADISLFDPTIRSALSGKGPDGKPTSKTLWQFENDLRNDPRWLKTKNANDAMFSTARKVLNDFGLSS